MVPSATWSTAWLREPGFGRGHVVDFIAYGHLFIGNVADIAIVAAAAHDRRPRAARHHLDGCGTTAIRRSDPPGGRPRMSEPVPQPGEQRSLPVPEGLEGERLDAAMARLFGLSRTRAAELVGAGAGPAGRSAHRQVGPGQRGRLARGDVCPRRRIEQPAVAEPVPGLRVVHDDDDIVVVDKPVGVAAHPSPGWTGPTVVGGLAAAGYRISTSGAAERQGIVHRLDVGTSGLMVVAKSERAYTLLKRAFKERTVDKVYHALVQGHPGPVARHDRRARSGATRSTTTSSP